MQNLLFMEIIYVFYDFMAELCQCSFAPSCTKRFFWKVDKLCQDLAVKGVYDIYSRMFQEGAKICENCTHKSIKGNAIPK